MTVRSSIVPVHRIKLGKGILGVADLLYCGAGALGGGVSGSLAAGGVGCRKGHFAVLITVCIVSGKFQRGAVCGGLAVCTRSVGQVVGPRAGVHTVIACKQLDAIAAALAVHQLTIVDARFIHHDFLGICRQAGPDVVPLGSGIHQPAVDIGQCRIAQRPGVAVLLQHHLQGVEVAAGEPADHTVVQFHRRLLVCQILHRVLDGLASNGQRAQRGQLAHRLSLTLVHAQHFQRSQRRQRGIIQDLIVGQVQFLQSGAALQERKLGQRIAGQVQLAQGSGPRKAAALFAGQLPVGQGQTVQRVHPGQGCQTVRVLHPVYGQLFQLLQLGKSPQLFLVQLGTARHRQAGQAGQLGQFGPVLCGGVLHRQAGGFRDAIRRPADGDLPAFGKLLPCKEAACCQRCHKQQHRSDQEQHLGAAFFSACRSGLRLLRQRRDGRNHVPCRRLRLILIIILRLCLKKALGVHLFRRRRGVLQLHCRIGSGSRLDPRHKGRGIFRRSFLVLLRQRGLCPKRRIQHVGGRSGFLRHRRACKDRLRSLLHVGGRGGFLRHCRACKDRLHRLLCRDGIGQKGHRLIRFRLHRFCRHLRELMSADLAEFLRIELCLCSAFRTKFHGKFSSLSNTFRFHRKVYGHSCTSETIIMPLSCVCTTTFRYSAPAMFAVTVSWSVF